VGVAWRQSEECLGLQQPGCGELLLYDVASVGTARADGEGSADEEEQLGAGFVGPCDEVSCGLLLEAELGVACELQELGAAQPLKELELQQMVV